MHSPDLETAFNPGQMASKCEVGTVSGKIHPLSKHMVPCFYAKAYGLPN